MASAPGLQRHGCGELCWVIVPELIEQIGTISGRQPRKCCKATRQCCWGAPGTCEHAVEVRVSVLVMCTSVYGGSALVPCRCGCCFGRAHNRRLPVDYGLGRWHGVPGMQCAGWACIHVDLLDHVPAGALTSPTSGTMDWPASIFILQPRPASIPAASVMRNLTPGSVQV